MTGELIRGAIVERDLTLEADVVIIGSGPAGAISAAILSAAGARVIVLEEGDLHAPDDFPSDESTAYLSLYQEAGARATADGAITILQGRTVGGGSTVNWMTSLRTPTSTLEYWRERHKVEGIDDEALAPHFEAVERRLNIHPASPDDINANNAALLRGLKRLGWSPALLPRNTHECTNLGLCGFGCPIPAKRTATLTWLEDARARGVTLVTSSRVSRILRRGNEVSGVEAHTRGATARRITVSAPRAIVAGGAINTPALLLRSGIASRSTGRRTWLHPVVATLGEYDERIAPWSGSPQSVGSHHFAERDAAMGFFLETPPIHPVLAALAIPAFGAAHRDLMNRVANSAAIIGLCIDGFSGEEPGGTVTIDGTGHPKLRYPFTRRLAEAANAAMTASARIHLAAGAHTVRTLHNEPVEIRSDEDLVRISRRKFGPNLLSIFSAHPMGGCAMGEDPRVSVVDSRGRHHQTGGLHVFDGSVFPTSLGVNPMLTIYGIASLFATDLANG